MAKCIKCGKRGLFLKLQNGLCSECVKKEKRKQELVPKWEKYLEKKKVAVRTEAGEATTKKKNIPPRKIFTPIPEELGWEVKYKYENVKIALPKMGWFKNKLKCPQITLQIYQDKNNEYDENAVMLADGLDPVGYLYKGKIQDMANDWLDRDDKIYVGVSKIDLEKEEVFLTLAFYKSIEETLMLYKKSATLVRTSIKQEFEDRQENISYLEEGDFVDIDIYTTEFENAVVTDSSGGELGELPTALSEKMREDNYDYIGKVIALTENDSGKYGVKIMIFREPTDE